MSGVNVSRLTVLVHGLPTNRDHTKLKAAGTILEPNFYKRRERSIPTNAMGFDIYKQLYSLRTEGSTHQLATNASVGKQWIEETFLVGV